MIINNSVPLCDGFHMPAEFEKHAGTIMIWPVRPGSWPNGGVAAKKVFARLAGIIAKHEKMYMLCDSEHVNEVREYLLPDCNSEDSLNVRDNIHVTVIESDDAWARDVGPTYVVKDSGKEQDADFNCKECKDKGCNDKDKEASQERCVRGINWTFNAWGGDYDGLYANWDKDDMVASKFCDSIGYDYYDASPFVLEGGSIHVDGEGTAIVTERCLLSKGRNPELTKEQIETKLMDYLGVSKVIWLPYGIYNDETNEHVDNVCAFTSPANVVLAWTDDENDPQYEYSKTDLDVLMRETDARGRRINVHKLYIPKIPVTVTEEELKGYEFEEGEDVREAGERLAASYANFYIANGIVLVPQFGDDNDEAAVKLLAELMPDREVIGIYARDIILGGGNIHCITQQIPE